MKALRKQIRESFFNPILHLFPLLLFLVLDEFYGMEIAWKVTFPFALVLVFYVYYRYNNIFVWHIMFTFLFMGVGLIASLVCLLPIPDILIKLENKIVVSFIFICLLAFRNTIQKSVLKIVPKLIPMTNNFNELYWGIWSLLYVLIFYIAVSLILQLSENENTENYLILLRTTFIGVLTFMAFYEILKVQIIRTKLVTEEWWPIVSEQGKIIGSIQYLTSLFDEKKYLHPIVRVLLIDKSMIFLQKRYSDDLLFPGMWDSAISHHVRIGETIEKCIERTANEQYALNGFKYIYLANYTLETKKEKHYAFLFVSCQHADLKPNIAFSEDTKWWTQQQIEENLDTCIFTENFKIEFDFIKRSGLLETGKCECACRLKEVIYKQTYDIKKETATPVAIEASIN